MHIPSPRPLRKGRIEIIPLIDIIFFLLATFVMVSTSLIKNQGIPVDLPLASTGQAQERNRCITISLTADGRFFFNKELVDWDRLIEQLHQVKAENPDPRLFINGDAQAYFGQAVAILDQVRKLGITKVSIETVAK